MDAAKIWKVSAKTYEAEVHALHQHLHHLGQAGVDLPTVKRISGHKNQSMVERYSHQISVT